MVDQDQSALSRPLPEDARSDFSFVGRLKSNIVSIQVMLLLVGVGASLIGAIVWLFIRNLASAGILVLGIGVVLLLIDAAISWRAVGSAIFGRRGRYGANTVILVIAFIAISAILNWLVFWLADRPEPMGWLRVDTTATKQFILSDQAIAILNSVDEPIRANAFFVTDTPSGAAAWRETQDLLNEFRRRSSKGFEFRLIDPDLEPNLAAEFGVTVTPSIAIEGLETRRVETVRGADPRLGPQVFTENDISTSLLIVSQIEQKGVLFITGHGEADITDNEDGTNGFGRALRAIIRDNYAVASATMQDLARILSTIDVGDGGGNLPAVIIFAGPRTDLEIGTMDTIDEVAILLQYMRLGGSVLFMFEPDTTATWREVIGRYGLTIGTSQLIDTSSFVAPNANFLQIKKSNGQITTGHQITDPIDVIYMPGATYVTRTVDDASVPLTDDGTPYFKATLLALTTLASWEESGDAIQFDLETDIPGPLPVAVAVEAIAELSRTPEVDENGDLIRTNIVLIGDVDFGTNSFFSSAKNGDLLANSVNWLARDFELISTRPKTRVFRELVLTQSERDFIRWTGWLLMPVLFGTIGMASWWRRR